MSFSKRLARDCPFGVVGLCIERCAGEQVTPHVVAERTKGPCGATNDSESIGDRTAGGRRTEQQEKERQNDFALVVVVYEGRTKIG